MTRDPRELHARAARFFEFDARENRYFDIALAANARLSDDQAFLFSHVKPGSDVLDVGCGPAVAAELLQGVRYVGLDGSQVGLRVAAGRPGAKSGLVRGDATVLPFRDASFDVVLSLRCVEYLAEPRRFLREVVRVLRPGGLFLLNGPVWEMPHRLPPSARNVRGLRRAAFMARRHARQAAAQLLRRWTYFEIVPNVAAFEEGHRESDDDAVYVVSPYQIERFLRLEGMDVLFRKRDTTVRQNPRPWRRAVGLLATSLPPWTTGYTSCNIVARKL
jgi:ubiquinone/menaquinone biosynthesis C-methylase UbiE